jgi:hypothetical protein
MYHGKRVEEHGSSQREMERHCPRGQSPSRVVAPVKKKVSVRNELILFRTGKNPDGR